MSLRYLLLDQLRYLQTVGHDVRAISGAGPWVHEVRESGIPVDTVPFTRRVDPRSDLRALGALMSTLARTRPEIVHTHTPKASLLGQWGAMILGIKRRVHTIHGLYFPGHMKPEHRWRYEWLERIQMAPAHLILSQNADDMETARRDGIADATKLRFLGNGVDVQRFTPANASPRRKAATREELRIPEDHLVVGIVARLVREKGYQEYFAAAAKVLRERPLTTFISIGGKEADKADAISPHDPAVRALGPRLRLLGHRDDLTDLYGAMDVLVLPSHREGFPRAPMEASATGVPVIATNVRGCRDTVIDGRTGLLVPLKDPESLAAAILRLLGDSSLRTRMGVQARQLAEERFDQRLVFERVAAAYAELERSA